MGTMTWRGMAFGAALVLLGAMAERGFASPAQGVQTVSAQGLQRVTVVSEVDFQDIVVIQNQWTDITDATAALTVPNNVTQALFLVRFEADNAFENCSLDTCQLRITLDGSNMQPDVVEFWDGGPPTQAVDRWLTVGPGAHTVQVQLLNTEINASHVELNGWLLTLEVAKVS